MRDTMIRLGDKFVKVGGAGAVLVVRRVVEFSDHPPHVQVTSESDGRLRQTLSISALSDRRLFRPFAVG